MTTTYSIATETNFILTKLADLTVVFPTSLVSEILIIDPAKILPLPFYDHAVCGCVHQAGRTIPLIALGSIFGLETRPNGQNLTAVCLSETAGEMAGTGLVIERLLGSQTKAQLPLELFEPESAAESSHPNMRLFQPGLLSTQLWQPQRWLNS